MTPALAFAGSDGLVVSRSVAVTGGSGGVLHATPSTLAAVFASARPGDAVLLAPGAYASFAGGVKAGTVTLRPEPGAAVSMAGAALNGAAYVALQGIRFTSGVLLDNGTHHVVLNGCTLENLGPALFEGRLSINRGAHHNAITNTRFLGNVGCSDGVFIGAAPDNTVGPGNEFSGIKQAGCSNHCDAIQLYDGPRTRIVGNYFHDCDTHIMAPDGGDHQVITDNVFVVASYEPTVQLGSHVGSIFEHNTCVGINVHMDSKTGSSASRDGALRNNVMVRRGTGCSFNVTNGSGCPTCAIAFNLFSTVGDMKGSNAIVAAPVLEGGASPTTWAGYALAAGSPGRGSASDGLDRGIRIGAA